MQKIKIFNIRGFSMTELVVGLGAFAVFMAGSAGVMQMYMKKNYETQSLAWLQELQYSISRSLRDPNTKTYTLNHPGLNQTTFDCIINKTDCTGAGGPFVLRVDNTLPQAEIVGVSSPDGPTEGMTYRGTVCNGFDPTNGNDACPLRYEMSWQAICPEDRDHCLDPQIKLTATLRHEPENEGFLAYINKKAFEVTHIWRERAENLQDTCASVYGSWSGGRCWLPFIGQCPAGSFLVGFNADGTKICDQPAPVTCPEGQVITGIAPDGTVQCGPGCLDTGTSSHPFQPGG